MHCSTSQLTPFTHRAFPSGHHYSVCCISVCVFLFGLFFISYLMSEIIWHLSFSTRLILLDMIPSRSIHGFVANGKTSFLFYGWVMFVCARVRATFVC